MNFQVAVFFIGSQFQKLKEQSSCYGDRGNKKVFCLICTCMERNSGVVAHAVSFCSTVFVLALKNNDLSRLLHHASWINDNKIQTYSGSERIKTLLPSLSNWHFSPSFPLSADARCCHWTALLGLLQTTAQMSFCSLHLWGPIWPTGHVTFTGHVFAFAHFLTFCPRAKKGNNP